MRGPIGDVPFVSPRPLCSVVPGMLLDDDLFLALCLALDDLLTPALAAVDCFPAYLDPLLTPDDFLAWLGALVGSEPRRSSIAAAVAGYGDRGTATGLRASVAAAAGLDPSQVTIVDPGRVTWSRSPTVGAVQPAVPARVVVAVPSDCDPATCSDAVSAAVEAVRPVHCPVEVEVVTT